MVGVSFQPLLGISAAGAASITQVLSATSTATTITFPASIQAGDLIVLLDYTYLFGAAAPTTVTPTGFTILNNVTLATTDGIRSILSMKLAAGTETGSLTGMSGDASRKLMVIFRRSSAAASLTSGSVNGQITNGDPTAQNVTASAGVAPLVIIGTYAADSSAVTTRTFTVSGVAAKDSEINSLTEAYLAWKIYNSSPADAVIDMVDNGIGNALQSCYIQMA